MKKLALAMGLVLLAGNAAMAQTSTTSPLPAPRQQVDTSGPLPGANSFTESQVRARLEENGFGSVTNLRKDDQGIWRAQATRSGGAAGPVSVDYRGNIFQQ